MPEVGEGVHAAPPGRGRADEAVVPQGADRGVDAPGGRLVEVAEEASQLTEHLVAVHGLPLQQREHHERELTVTEEARGHGTPPGGPLGRRRATCETRTNLYRSSCETVNGPFVNRAPYCENGSVPH